MDLDRIVTMHAELDDFVRHQRAEPCCLVFEGSFATYDIHEIARWASLKHQLRTKLREEQSAAVAFWDSNQICWSSSADQVLSYGAHERGFYMFRDQLPLPLVYVAGPYSAKTREGVLANVARAEQLGLKVAELGGMPVIPHTNTSHADFERVQPYGFWIRGTMKLLHCSDAVIMTDDWELSGGARGEHTEAKRLGKPVFQAWESLKLWIEALP